MRKGVLSLKVFQTHTYHRRFFRHTPRICKLKHHIINRKKKMQSCQIIPTPSKNPGSNNSIANLSTILLWYVRLISIRVRYIGRCNLWCCVWHIVIFIVILTWHRLKAQTPLFYHSRIMLTMLHIRVVSWATLHPPSSSF